MHNGVDDHGRLGDLVRRDYWKNAARNRAKNPGCSGLLIAARTWLAAVAALIVSPWWQ